MAEKRDWKKKWYWAGLGTILATIISDNISEHTKNIPILNYVVNFFKWLYIKAYTFLTLPVKLWIILAAILIIFILRKITKGLGNKGPNLPIFHSYTADRFHNWTWKWNWENFGRGWEVNNLTPFCSKCDVELSVGGSLFSPAARCPACKEQYGEYRQFPVEFPSDTEKLIRAKANKIKEHGR